MVGSRPREHVSPRRIIGQNIVLIIPDLSTCCTRPSASSVIGILLTAVLLPDFLAVGFFYGFKWVLPFPSGLGSVMLK